MLRQKTILVAEDDPDLRQIFASALHFRGFAVLLAETGDECLASASAEGPDLIILDIMMPGRDGIDTAAQLRANSATSSLPIVALTALARSSIRARALQAGCDLVLLKPISPSDLLHAITYLLEERLSPGDRTTDLHQLALREHINASELIATDAPLVQELNSELPVQSGADLRNRLQATQIVPVCSFCGRVRTSGTRWRQMAARLRAFFDQWNAISHGVCPDCLSREYPGVAQVCPPD